MVSYGVTLTTNWFVRQKALLLEVCLQSRLRACTASRVHCQRQLVQRRTTVAEVIVWQQLNARQLHCISTAHYTITDNIILPWHANYLNHHRLPGLITFVASILQWLPVTRPWYCFTVNSAVVLCESPTDSMILSTVGSDRPNKSSPVRYCGKILTRSFSRRILSRGCRMCCATSATVFNSYEL